MGLDDLMVVSAGSGPLAHWTPHPQEGPPLPSGPASQLFCQKEVLGSTHGLGGHWWQMPWPIHAEGVFFWVIRKWVPIMPGFMLLLAATVPTLMKQPG